MIESNEMEERDNVQIIEGRKRPPTTCYKNAYLYFLDFCENTKIHGFGYLAERKRFMIERLFWILFMSMCFSACGMLLKRVWVKNQSTVFVTVTQNPVPVWTVPFPAITICPETKVKQTVYNFTKDYHRITDHLETHNMTQEEYQYFSDISLVCDNHLHNLGGKAASIKAVEHLVGVAPPLSEVFFSCRWLTTNESCDTLFTRVLTDDGVCYTFNMLDGANFLKDSSFKAWTPEDGYSTNLGTNVFPRKTTSGYKNGLFLLLRAHKQDLDYVCRGPTQGFKVHLHSPAEIPRVANHYFRAPLNQELLVAVKPDVKKTAKSLKEYDAYERQCFFSGESSLKFFQTYSQENCRVECLANFTLAKCGCVAYHMPRNQSTKICGSGSNKCMLYAEEEFLQNEIESETFHSDFNKNAAGCSCLPACTSITYNAETSQTDFNWPKVFQAFKTDLNEFPGIQMSRVAVFFKEMQISPSERNVLRDQTDFLAACGGLLALFGGFSLLSLVEIIYYLTVRLLCNLKKHGKQMWSDYSTSNDNFDGNY